MSPLPKEGPSISRGSKPLLAGSEPARGVEKFWSGTYIYVTSGVSAPKTRRWYVPTTQGDVQIGMIGWWGAWRRYTFQPEPDTIFEEKCLREIAEFIEAQTKLHKVNETSSA